MKRFFIETYGCQMNVADSESISAILLQAGYKEVLLPENADLIVVNTCAVRDTAVSKVKAQICRFKTLRKTKGVKVAVAGCMAEHEKEQLLKELPIDFVVGPDRYLFLAELSDALPPLAMGPEDGFYEGVSPARKKGVSGWIPVMRGCDNFCSYCVVPFVRGRERSKPFQTILKEAKQAVAEGFKEMTLLGQNVNSYKDGENGFPDLLRALDKISGLERIRFMTSHPKDLSDDLISCFGNLRTLCEHIHLPVQSGSNRILEKMNRRYTREQYLRLVEKLRKQLPALALTTDVLCGFPGETDADHADTLALLKEVEYDAAFTFIYSKRKGTVAADMEEQIPREVKIARLGDIIRVQTAFTKSINEQTVGREVEILVEFENPREKGIMSGRTRSFKNVILPGTEEDIGRLLKVRIEASTGWTLKAERT